MDDINESDCCGNGCANCVLNMKTKSCSAQKIDKQNILGRYTTFVLINKILHSPEVEDVWELHFKSKHSNDKKFILDIPAGHHIMMRKRLAATEKTRNIKNVVEKPRKYLLRPYSPFWWDEVEMEFKILVNLVPNGSMSEYLKNFVVNDEVEFRGPVGAFTHQADERGDKHLLIISQGVAIAPVIPIIEKVLNNEDDMTRIAHIACFQDVRHVYFREKLHNFSKYWNYKAYIFLSNELCENTDCKRNLSCLETCTSFKRKLKYKENIKPYRFTENKLKVIVDNLGKLKENSVIIIAGNGKFQNSYLQFCNTIKDGILKNNINLL